jgi:hypothetical protein
VASRISRHGWLVGSAAAVAVIVVVIVLLVVQSNSGSDEKPPPLSTSAPDVFRITLPSSPGIPAIPVPEKLTDGSVIGLSLWSISTVNGQLVATITFEPPGVSYPDTHPVEIAAGASKVIDGFRVQILHLWAMPNRSNSAADIHVTPLA